MKRYTDFSSFEELLSAGGFEVNSQEDFEAIPNDKFNEHISKTTKFKSWEDMQSEAAKAYMVSKLKF